MTEISPFWLIIAASGFALVPVALGIATSYVKVSIVLSMIRNALGTQQVPGSVVIMALSLSLTAFIMGPVLDRSIAKGKEIDAAALLRKGPSAELFSKLGQIAEPWSDFMRAHSHRRELEALAAIDAKRAGAANQAESAAAIASDPPIRVIIPAFVLSELREAFTMGFLVLLPFLVIDLIVSNILAGMGMFMVSPVLVSLPLKLLVFVLSDAWLVIVRGLILSYQ